MPPGLNPFSQRLKKGGVNPKSSDIKGDWLASCRRWYLEAPEKIPADGGRLYHIGVGAVPGNNCPLSRTIPLCRSAVSWVLAPTPAENH